MRGLRDRLRDDREGGFTLVEVVVAGMIIAVVMAATTEFFLSSTKTTRVMAGRQSAAQVATSVAEQVRGTDGYAVAGGTGQATVDNVQYSWQSTVTTCNQARMTTNGTCPGGPVVFKKVVVTVTWSDANCKPSGTCTLTTTELVSSAANDPTFNSNG
jgi:type II secretory pathway pseudopilin PulG